jgi:hypothetical protein
VSPLRRSALLIVWALVLFVCCCGLDTRHNRFPFFRHPDEPGKVDQVLKAEWNFHHPMLLLAATTLAVNSLHVPKEEQAIVEAGRWVSAIFTSAAVVILSLLAYLWRGWRAAFISGTALTLHHQLYELAHYMKEDSALLLGIALSLAAALWFWRKPSNWRAALLGISCAVAVSGKYIGLMMLALAVPLLCSAPGMNRVRRATLFGTALLAVFVLVNLPLLADPTTFQHSFGREMDSVMHGQRGMTRAVPHAQYWNVFLDNTTPAVWLLLLAFLVARWRERSRVTPAEWSIIAFPFIYGLALSFSPKSNDRYFLPATALFTLFAVLGIEDAANLLARRFPRPMVITSLTFALLLLELTGSTKGRPGLWRYDQAFQHDDVEELVAWIKEELPPEAVVVCDNRVGLPDSEKKKHPTRGALLPQKVWGGRFAADFGSLAELRAEGVTHVIVSESDYGRFFLEGLRPQEGEIENFHRRKSFYEELFRDGNLLWERPRGTVIYLHPGIRVFRI